MFESFFLNQQFITWCAKANRGSYFCNYIYRTQTNMKKEKERSKKKKTRKELLEKYKERKKIKTTLKERLIVIECESIRISSQEHNEMF